MKHLIKYNESISSLRYETFDFFDIVVEKIKNYKGYTVFSIEKEEQFCKIFNFENKKDFERNFSIEKHPYYPGNIVSPKDVIEDDQTTSDICIIDGQKFFLNTLELYLIVDGKLMR